MSATKTELSERKLSSLIASQQSIIVSDITRLGRQKVMEFVGAIGQKMKSKLDEYTAYILTLIDKSSSKAEIIRQLNERGVSISRSRFYSWLEARGLYNKKAEFQADMFFE